MVAHLRFEIDRRELEGRDVTDARHPLVKRLNRVGPLAERHQGIAAGHHLLGPRRLQALEGAAEILRGLLRVAEGQACAATLEERVVGAGRRRSTRSSSARAARAFPASRSTRPRVVPTTAGSAPRLAAASSSASAARH